MKPYQQVNLVKCTNPVAKKPNIANEEDEEDEEEEYENKGDPEIAETNETSNEIN